jgi:hypothetical protein
VPVEVAVRVAVAVPVRVAVAVALAVGVAGHSPFAPPHEFPDAALQQLMFARPPQNSTHRVVPQPSPMLACPPWVSPFMQTQQSAAALEGESTPSATAKSTTAARRVIAAANGG